MKVLACLSVLVVIAPTAVADTVLLDFTAKWCPPCRQMESVIAGLEREGHNVKRLDIDVPENKAKAQQYRVKEIPTFIVLKDGLEAGRVVGAVPADSLRRLLNPAPAARPSPKSVPHKADKAAADSPIATQARAEKPGVPNLIRYSVRIIVDDARSRSFGTGTVIRSVPGETLVLTCGHLFEGVSRQAKTTVEFFGVSERPKLAGELVARDKEADLSLVRITTSASFPAAPVAPATFAPRTGLPAASVGCDNGNAPTVRHMRITAVNRYVGAPTIECSGEPVEGRSGGGLFNDLGEVIGVCSARDPAEHRGIYGGTAAIHALLERNQLAALYKSRPADESAIRVASHEQPSNARPLNLPKARELALEVDRNLPLPDGAETAEVVCVIRSADAPNGPAKVVVLNRASPEFLSALDKEQAKQVVPFATSMVLPGSHGDATADPERAKPTTPEPVTIDATGWRRATKSVPPANRDGHGQVSSSGPIQESAKWQKDWPVGASSTAGPVKR